MLRTVFCIATAFVLLAPTGPAVQAQSVADIVERMYDVYEAQAEGIDNYTLYQNTMGVATVSYFEKQMVDGRPIFMVKKAGAPGFALGFGGGENGQGDLFDVGPNLIEYGRYEGREDVDGISTHVIAVDDVSKLDLAGMPGPEDMEFTPKSARFYIDTDRMVPVRMAFVGDAETDSGEQEVTMTVNLREYREVESLLIPYHMYLEVQGLGAMMDDETRAQFEEMQQQLENMPPDQRQMMESMMGPQIEQLRQMMASGGDTITMEIEVTDVRVNEGPPNE